MLQCAVSNVLTHFLPVNLIWSLPSFQLPGCTYALPSILKSHLMNFLTFVLPSLVSCMVSLSHQVSWAYFIIFKIFPSEYTCAMSFVDTICLNLSKAASLKPFTMAISTTLTLKGIKTNEYYAQKSKMVLHVEYSFELYLLTLIKATSTIVRRRYCSCCNYFLGRCLGCDGCDS